MNVTVFLSGSTRRIHLGAVPDPDWDLPLPDIRSVSMEAAFGLSLLVGVRGPRLLWRCRYTRLTMVRSVLDSNVHEDASTKTFLIGLSVQSTFKKRLTPV